MDAIVARMAEQHHGVFRIEHALEAGLTRHQIATRLAQGRWSELYQGVYRLRGAPPSWRGDLLAATWAGGTRAVGSVRSAAKVYGLPGGRGDLIEVTCPRWRRARHDGLIVHESKVLTPVDITAVDGIRVTTVARTLFDLGGVYGRGMVELALERALERRLVSIGELDRLLRRVSRSGRPGGPILRDLVAARSPQRRPTESVMEAKLLQAMRRYGLPEPVVQYEVWSGDLLIGRVDFAYPEAKIAIEYDSDEFHTGRAAVRRDRARRHELIAAGWLPVDVGPADLRRGAASACAAIADALRRFGVSSTA